MTRSDLRGLHLRQGGFSYLWVLLMVAFMGLNLTLAVAVDSTAVQRDREKELLAVGRQFRTAIGRYYESQMANGKREYPATLDDLLKDNRVGGIRRHLRRVFVDPVTSGTEWGLVRVGGRIVGVHSLSEKVPIKQAGFEAEDMAFQGRQKYSEWVFSYPFDLMPMGEAGPRAGSPASEPKVDDPSRKETARR